MGMYTMCDQVSQESRGTHTYMHTQRYDTESQPFSLSLVTANLNKICFLLIFLSF